MYLSGESVYRSEKQKETYHISEAFGDQKVPIEKETPSTQVAFTAHNADGEWT
jgi:hypothetical protein